MRSVGVLLSSLLVVNAQTLPDALLGKIKARMNESSTASWEMGTRAQTLTELDFPEVSVFSPDYLSPTPPSATTLDPVISIARNAVNSRSSKQLVNDGSAADPASLGVAVLLANFTNASGANFDTAAEDQLNLLLYNTPRSPSGAISHRTEYAQLWSDFIYMVPPFLAYYGAVTSNETLLSESVRQISLYRDELRASSGEYQGLWRHVISLDSGASWNDTGIWTTGNGWAAMGMLRVLATIKYSDYSKDFKDEMGDLTDWVVEILEGAYKVLPSSGLWGNYCDNTTFTDAAGSAIIAASTYRLVTLTGQGEDLLDDAEKVRSALYANNGSTHFDADGWLQPVVNPNSFSSEGSESPEGQAFVLQLDNNWKDYVANGKGKSSGMLSFHFSNANRVGIVANVFLVLFTIYYILP